MADLNVIIGVVSGEYGEAINLTLVDRLGNVRNVSTYTGSNTITLRSPDGTKTVSLPVSFATDGTDGVIYFTPTSGVFDRAGNWDGQVTLLKTNVVAKTMKFKVPVEEALS